jgi:uncharacterized membrane protein YgcG
MDAITLAITLVAIAGPAILALVLYWRNNPDRRLSWRRAAENSADTDPEHFRRLSGQAWLFFMIGGDSSGGGGGSSDRGGGSN